MPTDKPITIDLDLDDHYYGLLCATAKENGETVEEAAKRIMLEQLGKKLGRPLRKPQRATRPH